MTEYLPLGSIALLKDGIQKVFIISRAIKVRNGSKEFFFDYGGVPYPEGLVGDQMAYFNHGSVSHVIFTGYSDEENLNMVENINRYLEENPDILRGDPSNWEV